MAPLPRIPRFVLIAAACLSLAACSRHPEELVSKLIAEGYYGKAEARAVTLLEKVEDASGSDSLEAARVIDLLVEALWRGGKAHDPRAMELAERALEIKKNVLGPDHIDLAVTLDNLGVVRFQSGEQNAAEKDFQDALRIRELNLDDDDPRIAESLDYLGIARLRDGDLPEAERYFRRAVAIREQASETEPLDVSLNYLGVVLWERGDYAAALPVYERALAIRESRLDAGHPLIAGVLDNLAILVYDMGDNQRAAELYTRALRLREKLGRNHSSVATTLNNLAHVLWSQGDEDGARRLIERALGIWERVGDRDGGEVTASLELLGRLEQSAGNYAAAAAHYERVVANWEREWNPDHPRVAIGLAGHARALRALGRSRAAQHLLERALSIWSATLDPGHPYIAAAFEELAATHFMTGDAQRCLENALRAEERSREHLQLTSRSLAERQALHYSSVRISGLDLALTLSAAGRLDTKGRREALDAVIRSRALVLDEMASRHRALAAAEDPDVAALAGRLAAARTRLANLVVRPAPDVNLDRHRELVKAARLEKEQAEQALASRSAAFRRDRARGGIGLREVADALPFGSALVAIARYRHHTATNGDGDAASPSYMAFVLRQGDADPVPVPIGEASAVDSAIRRWSREAARERLVFAPTAKEEEEAYRKVGSSLRELIWDPLAPYLEDRSPVFVVPDGSPQLLSLATLPTDDNRYLAETGPLLHYLSAERDLVLLSRNGSRGRGLLIIGDPAFDATGPFAKARAGTETEAWLPPIAGGLSDCDTLQSMMFAPLSATAEEVREIGSMWEREARTPLVRLSGEHATETAFKKRAPGMRVLHLATHGYFLSAECGSGPGGTSAEHALLLSGLALAGANNRATAGPDEDDGILTGEEIAGLDLSGVEWTVLSACETGRGEVKTGEGVFGLRRAFQTAGVDTLILSLWPVEDRSTRRWMGHLYRARMGGASTAEAVRAANLGSLEDLRRIDGSAHPFFWGAFVAAGDWR